MGRPVAAKILEKDRVGHSATLGTSTYGDGVADPVHTSRHDKALTEMSEHLGHEGQGVPTTLAVQCREDLGGIADFDDVAGTESSLRCR
jgi:hypothetical protein